MTIVQALAAVATAVLALGLAVIMATPFMQRPNCARR